MNYFYLLLFIVISLGLVYFSIMMHRFCIREYKSNYWCIKHKPEKVEEITELLI